MGTPFHFNSAPSHLQRGTFANLVPASRHCGMPRHQAALSSSHCAGWLLHCLSLHHPIIVSLRQLVVASSLDILLLRPLHIVLLPPAACCIASCFPLVAPPSWLLIVLAGCCIASCCVALSSSHCTALLFSHCAGWLLSRLSLCCPLVDSLFWTVFALPRLPLLLLLLLPPPCHDGGLSPDNIL